MNMSDIFDIPLILVDNGKYYELEFNMYALDGFTDFPIKAFLTKGNRIYKKDVNNYEG